MDVRHDKNAREILEQLGRSSGQGASAATPATLVGSQLILGDDVKRIMDAIAAQHDWPPAR